MESMGVVVRRYIDFLLYTTPLVSVLFCSSIPIFFVHLKKCFSLFNICDNITGA